VRGSRRALASRSLEAYRFARGRGFDVGVGHGSNDLPVAARDQQEATEPMKPDRRERCLVVSMLALRIRAERGFASTASTVRTIGSAGLSHAISVR
jgi:hypothetical protein